MLTLKKVLIFIFIYLITTNIVANDLEISSIRDSIDIKQSFPVFALQDTLFKFYDGYASFSAKERALLTNQKINNIINYLKSTKKDSLEFNIKRFDSYSEIFYNNISLIAITDIDAKNYNTHRDSLVEKLKDKFGNKFNKANTKFNRNQLIKNIIFSMIIILIAISINFIILKFSYKFEILLMNLSEKQDYFITTIKGYKFNLKNLLYAFIYFYEGIKAIIIIWVIYKAIIFFLSLIDLDNYWDFKPLFTGLFNTLTTTIIFYYAYKLAKIFVRKVYERFNKMKHKILEKMQYKKFTIISEEKLIEIAKYATKILYNATLIFLLYMYITLIFSYFNFTETWAAKLFNYVLSPVDKAFNALISYLPNIFAIIVIYFLIKYVLKMIRFLFNAIENGTINIPNFYQEWSEPTYKIVRFLVIVFGLIVIFPYLPGSSSPFFKGISVFVGILFSLGSSSAIANMVAGVVLTYMRPFKVNDVVKISETMGIIIERTLLVTRIRTFKNVDITVPNGIVLNSHIINYSSDAQESGLVLHTSVTIGYDVPWKTIHDLLSKAATATNLVLKDPKPFVLQTSLDDFYVNYELNVYTKFPSKIPRIFSDLHQNIQDKFNEAGVEIMSPHYGAQRDGNQTTIPEKYLSQDYVKPAFKLDIISKILSKD
jgi:small-conductance mechanosensitive channel